MSAVPAQYGAVIVTSFNHASRMKAKWRHLERRVVAGDRLNCHMRDSIL
jgi:hypothetical protein